MCSDVAAIHELPEDDDDESVALDDPMLKPDNEVECAVEPEDKEENKEAKENTEQVLVEAKPPGMWSDVHSSLACKR